MICNRVIAGLVLCDARYEDVTDRKGIAKSESTRRNGLPAGMVLSLLSCHAKLARYGNQRGCANRHCTDYHRWHIARLPGSGQKKLARGFGGISIDTTHLWRGKMAQVLTAQDTAELLKRGFKRRALGRF